MSEVESIVIDVDTWGQRELLEEFAAGISYWVISQD